MRMKTRLVLAGAVLAASVVVAPMAEADGWRDRAYRDGPRWSHGERHGRGWDRGSDRGWGPPGRVGYPHDHGRRDQGWDTGSLALGAIVGLGAGVVLGTMLAPQPAGPGR